MAETEFTFKDASGTTKTALAGATAGGKLAPAAVLYAIDGTQLIGQKARTASLPVTLSSQDVELIDGLETLLASLQTLLAGGLPAALTGSGNLKVAITENSANSDPATGARQTTGNTSLSSIDTKLTDVATQTTLAAILAKLIATPATAANQATEIASLASLVTQTDGIEGSLSSIDTKTPALGQALAAASTPVVLPAAQITTLTPPAAITGFATETTLAAIGGYVDGIEGEIGATNESAAATDTSTSGLNGLFKRLLQRVTTLLAVFPTTIDTNSGNKSASTLRVVLATDQPTMSNAQPVAQSGTWTMQPGNTPNTSPWLTTQTPATSGGLSIYKNLDIDETGVSVKGSAGQLFGWYIFNAAASTRYVKLYNTSSAPTVGTTTPVFTLGIPAGAAANVEFANGIAFGTGIGLGATTGVADNSTGAPSTNDVVITLFYK